MFERFVPAINTHISTHKRTSRMQAGLREDTVRMEFRQNRTCAPADFSERAAVHQN